MTTNTPATPDCAQQLARKQSSEQRSEQPGAQISLEARLAHLEAIEAIRDLKTHYAALADAKYTVDYQRQAPLVMDELAKRQAQCFTADAVWAGGSGFGEDLVGFEALHAWFQRSPWRFAMHYYTSETIQVASDGHVASATWRLFQIALRDDDAHAVLLGAATHERYRRELAEDGSERWLISHMRFEQLQMLELGTGALPLAPDFAGLDRKRADSRAFLAK